MSQRWHVDLPNPESRKETPLPMIAIDSFDSEQEAIAFVQEAFGADENGSVCLVSAGPQEEDEDQEDEDKPAEGDLYTEDFCQFFEVSATQTGFSRLRKPVFTVAEGQEWRVAVQDYQDRSQFWGNIWNVSDHGNISLVKAEDEKT